MRNSRRDILGATFRFVPGAMVGAILGFVSVIAVHSPAVFFGVITLDRSLLTERVRRLGPKGLAQILDGVDVVLGR